MLAIITAFRSRLLARDWDYHVWLLQRCLVSILSQTNDAFVVAVVCHEQPRTPFDGHPRVRFLAVDFPPPDRDNDEMCADKVLKLSVGSEWAISKNYEYIMFTDADDLVSRRLSEFVATNRGANGWYTPAEFYHAYGSRWVRKNSRPPTMSGPGVIVRSNLLKFAMPPFTGDWLNMIVEGGERPYAELLARQNRKINTLAAVGLAYFQRLMTADGHPLEALPFPGNVVINHLDSTSHVPGGIGTAVSEEPAAPAPFRMHLGRLKRVALSLPSVRPLTHALRSEFTIPAPDVVPVAYRGRGSMFSRDIFVESSLGRS
jgi:hypothetical protein